jgi:hypothetical protein
MFWNVAELPWPCRAGGRLPDRTPGHADLPISTAFPAIHQHLMIFFDDTDIMEYMQQYLRLRYIAPKERLCREPHPRSS